MAFWKGRPTLFASLHSLLLILERGEARHATSAHVPNPAGGACRNTDVPKNSRKFGELKSPCDRIHRWFLCAEILLQFSKHKIPSTLMMILSFVTHSAVLMWHD